MSRRFYVENEIVGDQLTIDGPDAHHIAVVNRMQPGDDIVLFDGSGREFAAKIVEINKKSASVEIVQTNDISRELQNSVTLAVAIPKGDRQKMLVEKLVELGVYRLIPLNCERSVAIASAKSVERLKRRVIEASKQCGRNVLMTIAPPAKFCDFLEQDEFDCRLVAHPYKSQSVLDVTSQASYENGNVVVAIGPEGGFSESEVELAIEKKLEACFACASDFTCRDGCGCCRGNIRAARSV